MKISVSLSRKAVAVLRKRAKGAGQDLAGYASGVLERSALAASSLEELTDQLNASLAVADILTRQVRELLAQAKREKGRGQRRTKQKP